MADSRVVVPTPAQIQAWPVIVPFWPDAASAFDLGRSTAYRLARAGEFPCPVLKLGGSLKVTRASVMAALSIPEAVSSAPSNSLAAA